jgi:GT2 family glycosyltransferase
MDHNDITVIILLYRTPKKLLKNLVKYKGFKVLILDQSNDLTNSNIIKNFLPKIQYYGLTERNIGFANAQNFLIKKIKTKYFFSTQPDISLSLKSILNLKRTLVKFKNNCVIAVPKIKGIKNIRIPSKRESLHEHKVRNMIGAAFMAEKKKFVEIGMFDPIFFFYWEDVELSNRINYSKYDIYLNSKSKAKHESGTSSKNNFKTMLIRNFNFKFGEYLFFDKINKLRRIKIIRQIISTLIYSILFLSILKFKKSFQQICYFYAIVKFLLKKYIYRKL